MAGVASKNLFDVLGNDDSEEPQPPTKAVDKSAPRSGKRNAAPEAPARDAGRGGARGGRHENATGNELAFRDRNAGRDQNRSKPSEDGYRHERRPHEGGEYRGRGRGRGGRGRGGPPRDDRHSKTGVTDHEKQVAHGWGGPTGNEEFADEKAGEAMAQAEQKEEGAETTAAAAAAAAAADGEAAAEADAPEPEPEDKTKSYTAWQAEQEAKRAALGGDLEVRKANEGSSKKFPEGKAIVRGDEEDDSYIAASGGKKKRERERKEKSLVELDNPKMYDQPREYGGRGRGSRGGRGDFRGDGPRRGSSDRGGRGGRGEFRGGRGGRGGSQGPNVNDQNAFPSLGA